MAQTDKNSFKKVAGIVSVCLFAVCLLATLGSVICAETVCDKDFYKNALCSDDYADKIYNELKTAAEIKTYIYTVPAEIADKLFTKEEVAADCAKYAEYLYNSAVSGNTEPMTAEFDADNARRILSEYIASGGSEILKPEDVDEYIIPELQELYNTKINAVTITKVHSQFNKALKPAYILRRGFAVLALLTTAFFTLSVYFGLSNIKKRFYSLSGVAFCVSSAVFAPLLITERFDLPSRLPLGNSPLKYLADSIVYSFTGKALIISEVALAISLACLIAAAAVRAFVMRKCDKSAETDNAAAPTGGTGDRDE